MCNCNYFCEAYKYIESLTKLNGRKICVDPFCPWDCFFEKREDGGMMEMNDQWSSIQAFPSSPWRWACDSVVGRGFLVTVFQLGPGRLLGVVG